MFHYPKELIDYMIKQTPKTVIALIALSAIYITIYYPYMPYNYIVIWVLIQLVLLALRYYNNAQLEKFLVLGYEDKIRQQIFFFAFLMFLSALTWSIGLIVGSSYAPAYFELISFIFILGLLTGAILSLSSIYPVYLLYLVTLLSMQLIYMQRVDREIFIDLVLLTIVYIPYILVISKTFNDKLRLTIEDNVHKDEDIHLLNKEIEETQKEVVFTMGAIGESRSKETGNHVKRVAEYSRLLALKYGVSKEKAELLKQASPMHDIGKIAIPDSILNKPGKLDEKERVIMDTHAELGHEMLKHSTRPLLKMAAIVAYEHHEKWDGSGYPNGLSGEEISKYGRITALADVFDALGSKRVYKEAWALEDILELFEAEKGKHFDPKLVEIFMENLDDFLAVRDKFVD